MRFFFIAITHFHFKANLLWFYIELTVYLQMKKSDAEFPNIFSHYVKIM